METKIEPHIILHLRITKDDIDSYLNNKIQTEPSLGNNNPIPYEQNLFGFNLGVSSIDVDKNTIPTENIDENIECSDVKMRVLSAMSEFADANRRKEWPRSTSLHCRWCVHPFSGPPVAIPKWYIQETFFVTGCYCSYSCAAAHLFNRSDFNETEKWEFYNLLHLLKEKILKKTSKIKLAPKQETLSVFGGHLSIDDFRDVTKDTHLNHKVYNIIEPPMTSIIPLIEETRNEPNIRFNKYVAPKDETYKNRWSSDNPYIPIDEKRMNRAIENLKIKRKAPLLDKKKTLLHYMNLKVNKQEYKI
jgi:hypothetical protein